MAKLTGTVDRVVYRNEDDGFVVARFQIDGVEGQRTYDDLATIVGPLGPVMEGELLHVSGEWERHPKHGPHFRVGWFERRLPSSTEGVERFLGSGVIKGIGPATAKRVVQCLGDETIEVLESQPGRLRSQVRLSQKRADLLVRGWNSQRRLRDLMVFLQSNSLPAHLARRILDQYGDEGIAAIQRDPYQLVHDVRGIGFKTADALAVKLGVPADSTSRMVAGLKFVLEEATRDGHVYLPKEALLAMTGEILGIQPERLEPALLEASRERIISLDGDRVFLTTLFLAERGSAQRLGGLLRASSFLSHSGERGRLQDGVNRAVTRLGISIAGQQLEAVTLALREKVGIITGGPGTGKTTCLHVIIEALDAAGVPYSLCAPTGRAAKRMTETTARPASTIHRLLGFQPADNRFEYNVDNQLPPQVIIVDEVSMIDIALFYSLLRALPDDSHLVLVGDADQLPAVGPGNVLQDLLDSETVPSIRLDQLFRQAENSQITVAAHAIRHGQLPSPGGPGDLYLIRVDGEIKAREVIRELVRTRIPRRFFLDPLTDIQVLSPTHRGGAGVRSLNEELQMSLNPAKPEQPEIRIGAQCFRPGDKVMQLHNNYEKDVYNGDLGRILSVDAESLTVKVGFGDGGDLRKVDYEGAELSDITLAYAISVHKSQGSEFPAVVIPLLTAHYPLLQRNLLYTGLTRARQLCVLVYQPKALHLAVMGTRRETRYTWLRERLAELRRLEQEEDRFEPAGDALLAGG
ncbi:MAG TPA: ATP-dependent RecD-like DNA helicase [Chloroflexota bacterium]|nr:ATP-dependent RecD-like DNA helicase [Chloroflexota bacterium]